MSQTTQIISHIKKGPITPLQALNLYGCLRLAARINDIRYMGYDIESKMVKRNGKRFAEYSLNN